MQPLLRNIRILELGHYVAAPFATRVLADLGADIIKVEPPGKGDPVRAWGSQVDGNSLWWSVHGRNKRSVTVNMRHLKSRQLILDLARHCDAVVENYRPGQLEKWGLGPADFEAVKPGMVMVRISGYGQTGPEAGRSGFGVIGEAKGGIRHLTGYPPEVTDLPPVRTGCSFGDSMTGLYGAIGALAAIIDQRSSGGKEIRVIDVALGESVLSLLEGALPEYSRTGRIRQPAGSRIDTVSPSNAYKSRDGAWVLIAANSDPLFAALCEIMGQPGVAQDARFSGNQQRCANNDALDAIISEWAITLDADDMLARLDEVNIPSSKIYTVADIVADEQYQARRMVTPVEDPLLGRLLHPGVVPVVDGLDRDSQIKWTGPRVGQHTDEVLGALLGLDAAAIAALREEQVI